MKHRVLAAALCAVSSFAACGDNVTPSSTPPPVTVSARVSGLTGGGLALRLNGGQAVTVGADGHIDFRRQLMPGSMYDITVAKQPSEPSQTCTVVNGVGVVGESPIEIAVACVVNTYNVGGMVSGLAGNGLVLDINNGETTAVAADGTFRFEQPLASGTAFAVTVASQPTQPAQTCTVSGASGVIGAGPVTTVVVNCATDRFTVGGTVSGLEGIAVVRNNDEVVMLTANGTYALPTTIASGDTYAVSVVTQPGTPSQTCTVSHGDGRVDAADITNVDIECITNTFTVGGSVDGLAGDGLVLRNNDGDDLAVDSKDGTFTFVTPVKSGEDYHVSIATQPTNPSQTCTVAGGEGTIGSGAVTSIAINCTTDQFTVGGAVTGLEGTGLILENNGELVYITGNGDFAFPSTIASGDTYDVVVTAQPSSPAQTCTVHRGSGTVENAAIADVSIECTTNRYAIGGNVSGLADGTTVTLYNRTDVLDVSNGSFQFPTTIAANGIYDVVVLAHPTSPAQTCHVTGGSGIVTSHAITNIDVSCHINRYAIGVTVSGLGSNGGLVLANNSVDELPIAINGLHYFGTSVPSGQSYAVTVLTQPAGQECTVAYGSGTVVADNIMDVTVTCFDVIPLCPPGTVYMPGMGCMPEMTTCPSGMYFDTSTGTCVPDEPIMTCGGEEQQCCADSVCHDGLACFGGQCGWY